MDIKEKIAIMQAYAEGKEIEISEIGENDWSLSCAPTWDWSSFDYRIKPENPKKERRPYTFDELQSEIAKGKFIVKTIEKRQIFTIVEVDSNFHGYGEVINLGGDLTMNFEQFMLECKWLDGSPCGVIEEE